VNTPKKNMNNKISRIHYIFYKEDFYFENKKYYRIWEGDINEIKFYDINTHEEQKNGRIERIIMRR